LDPIGPSRPAAQFWAVFGRQNGSAANWQRNSAAPPWYCVISKERAILTLSLSFNNDGAIGSFFRCICDNGTYRAFYDDLSDGKGNKIDVFKVDVSMDGIELEDREFIAAIKERREPNASLRQVLPCMQVLDKIEQINDSQRKAHV
jgi:predicted dehydrogenase